MAQSIKQFSAKIAKISIYFGYSDKGFAKLYRLKAKCAKLKTTPSKLVVDTLNLKYPDLGL